MDFTRHSPFSGFSVDDPERAKEFYSHVLGFDVVEEDGILWIALGGDTVVLAYPKGPQHEPASFTILNLPVDDVEETVAELKAQGVQFQHYDGEVSTDDDGIMRGNGPTIAWFRDPAGNIISVIEAID